MICESFAYPKLMEYFEEISKIPRPTYYESAVVDYLVSFAEQRGLEYYRDSANNLLINIPATEGMEGAAPILLQGHTDMVCEKNEGVEHNFFTDPLKLYVSEGWVRAEGTTLGADNGVAVAAMLAVLDGACAKHGAIQCLFTASEEVGLDGVKAFDSSRIYARKMINLDSADDAVIVAGCAGGVRSVVTIPVSREAREGKTLRISIGGLFGGHSGEDIHRGRANANKVMGRALYRLASEFSDLRLVSFNGGSKANAITRECVAVVSVDKNTQIDDLCNKISDEISIELSADDKGFFMKVVECTEEMLPMTTESGNKVIFLAQTIPFGVFAMNKFMPEIVEHSNNLGICATTETEFEVICNIRSAISSMVDRTMAELDAYANILGGKVEHINRYPGWIYSESSAIRDEYISAYSELFGRSPKIEVIHAGLESAIIKKNIPDMDIISCGAIVVNLHSPDEALNIASFERFFATLIKLLESAK